MHFDAVPRGCGTASKNYVWGNLPIIGTTRVKNLRQPLVTIRNELEPVCQK
jgi:hypothetical protein